MNDGNKMGVVERVKGEITNGTRCLGGQTLAPKSGGQQVGDLDLRRAVHLLRQKPTTAYQLTRLSQHRGPKSETMLRVME